MACLLLHSLYKEMKRWWLKINISMKYCLGVHRCAVCTISLFYLSCLCMWAAKYEYGMFRPCLYWDRTEPYALVPVLESTLTRQWAQWKAHRPTHTHTVCLSVSLGPGVRLIRPITTPTTSDSNYLILMQLQALCLVPLSLAVWIGHLWIWKSPIPQIVLQRKIPLTALCLVVSHV